MFPRIKKSGRYEYLQIVHNTRIDGRVRQQVLGTLGRLDRLRENGQLDSLIASLSRFSDATAVIGSEGRTAQEGVDAIGLSILSGSHVPICRRVAELLKEKSLSDVLWLVGGNIPKRDSEELKALGVDAVFAVGTPTQTIVDHIREKIS